MAQICVCLILWLLYKKKEELKVEDDKKTSFFTKGTLDSSRKTTKTVEVYCITTNNSSYLVDRTSENSGINPPNLLDDV